MLRKTTLGGGTKGKRNNSDMSSMEGVATTLGAGRRRGGPEYKLAAVQMLKNNPFGLRVPLDPNIGKRAGKRWVMLGAQFTNGKGWCSRVQ